MVDVSSQNNSVSINVSSSGNSASIKATPDTALYYSEKSREWAISDRIVDGKDYSSKYYANKAQTSANNAKTYADNAQSVLVQVQNVGSEVVEEINTTKTSAVSSVNTTKTSAITEINNTKTTAVNAVNTSKNQALNDIEKESSSIINFKEEVSAELENKVDLDDMVAFDMQEVTCIVESYVNGASGYNIWSNGYCEQWGSFTSNYTTNQEIYLLHKYKDINYTIIVTQTSIGSTTAQYYGSGKVMSKATDSFTFACGQTEKPVFDWRTCGYIA